MGLSLDQVDATDLGSSTSNSMLANFEDVPILNPVALIDTETTTPSTSAIDRYCLPCHLPANKNNNAVTF